MAINRASESFMFQLATRGDYVAGDLCSAVPALVYLDILALEPPRLRIAEREISRIRSELREVVLYLVPNKYGEGERREALAVQVITTTDVLWVPLPGIMGRTTAEAVSSALKTCCRAAHLK